MTVNKPTKKKTSIVLCATKLEPVCFLQLRTETVSGATLMNKVSAYRNNTADNYLALIRRKYYCLLVRL